jgi:hypothetical protein
LWCAFGLPARLAAHLDWLAGLATLLIDRAAAPAKLRRLGHINSALTMLLAGGRRGIR